MASPPAKNRYPLADELFLIGHHEYTGKRHTGEEVFGLGLAAAVLIELGWSRAIVLEDGAVRRTAQTFSGDPVLDHVLGKIAGQEPAAHQASSWIDYLREDLYTLVAGRLMRAAVVEEQTSGMLVRQVRYVAVDPVVSSTPRSMMLGALRNPPPPTHPPADGRCAILAGLVASMEMWEAVPTFDPDEVTHNAGLLMDRMYPSEQLIVKGVASVKGILARRVRR